jgi:histidine triad (HIT) family protein
VDSETCVFCKIAAGVEPASIIYEDEIVMVLLDISPVNDGHAMVIPKYHAAYLADLSEETGMHMFRIAQRTAAALRDSGVPCEGINMLLADGEAAFQDIFHIHLHVFPRFAGDDFRISADWDYKPTRDTLDSTALQIRQAYERLWSR